MTMDNLTNLERNKHHLEYEMYFLTTLGLEGEWTLNKLPISTTLLLFIKCGPHYFILSCFSSPLLNHTF